jgi:hypothetical protein
MSKALNVYFCRIKMSLGKSSSENNRRFRLICSRGTETQQRYGYSSGVSRACWLIRIHETRKLPLRLVGSQGRFSLQESTKTPHRRTHHAGSYHDLKRRDIRDRILSSVPFCLVFMGSFNRLRLISIVLL